MKAACYTPDKGIVGRVSINIFENTNLFAELHHRYSHLCCHAEPCPDYKIVINGKSYCMAKQSDIIEEATGDGRR